MEYKNKKIALIKDLNTGWWQKFSELLNESGIQHEIIEIEKDNWIELISNYGYIIWRPNLNKPFLDQAKDKIFLMEYILEKKIYPNLKTFWHYDNKNTEYYLGKVTNIKMPKGFVSYSYHDSLEYLRNCSFPIVSKSKGGAASKNVRLLKSFKDAKKELDSIFGKKYTDKLLTKLNLISSKQKNYVNYQEFISGNKKDLRIATIGGRYAYAFYRINRKNDFRASGSGLIDYNIDKKDLNAIRYFIQVSSSLGFDSMGYDVIYKDGDFLTVEFSYTFPEKLRPQYYELYNNEIILHKKSTFPQELILNYLGSKWNIPELKSPL